MTWNLVEKEEQEISYPINLLLICSVVIETVLAIEHNLNFIRNADWIIDLGPGGGHEGGLIVAQGTPESVVLNKDSVTGKYLSEIL